MGEDTQGARRKRLAEALRANLRRRKVQQRERSADPRLDLAPNARAEVAKAEETG